MTPPGKTHISNSMFLENVLLTSVLDFNDIDIMVQKFRGLASKDNMDLSELYQALKVEWQVKHPYYLTRISSHNFIQSYQIAI